VHANGTRGAAAALNPIKKPNYRACTWVSMRPGTTTSKHSGGFVCQACVCSPCWLLALRVGNVHKRSFMTSTLEEVNGADVGDVKWCFGRG
jgi:hypothetical protein